MTRLTGTAPRVTVFTGESAFTGESNFIGESDRWLLAGASDDCEVIRYVGREEDR
ncbi:hypothetical protein JQK87_28245 [Streptomyces sp. G44]|uniref:hypothetical protein n=1 Tax=Streptomyces sp. G44 TaxID=2807632 RepID=UPI00195FC739|nr:hypothetical protein [Streptomyces sp. G44]MBM7172218.1 hypothetical protein [Streptomyces sp. G44]